MNKRTKSRMVSASGWTILNTHCVWSDINLFLSLEILSRRCFARLVTFTQYGDSSIGWFIQKVKNESWKLFFSLTSRQSMLFWLLSYFFGNEASTIMIKMIKFSVLKYTWACILLSVRSCIFENPRRRVSSFNKRSFTCRFFNLFLKYKKPISSEIHQNFFSSWSSEIVKMEFIKIVVLVAVGAVCVAQNTESKLPWI